LVKEVFPELPTKERRCLAEFYAARPRELAHLRGKVEQARAEFGLVSRRTKRRHLDIAPEQRAMNERAQREYSMTPADEAALMKGFDEWKGPGES
jgi:hypothetical protein